MYFVLSSSSQDGIDVRKYTAPQLDKYLSELLSDNCGKPLKFLKAIPDIDDGCFVGVDEDVLLIILGDVIVPYPKSIVTKYGF